jgi:hypothetical protein
MHWERKMFALSSSTRRSRRIRSFLADSPTLALSQPASIVAAVWRSTLRSTTFSRGVLDSVRDRMRLLDEVCRGMSSRFDTSFADGFYLMFDWLSIATGFETLLYPALDYSSTSFASLYYRIGEMDQREVEAVEQVDY